MTKNIKHATTPVGDIAYVDRGKGLRHCSSTESFSTDTYGVTSSTRSRDAPLHCYRSPGPWRGPDITGAGRGLYRSGRMLEAVCIALKLDQVDLVANDSDGGISQIFAACPPPREFER